MTHALDLHEIQLVMEGKHYDPFRVLGLHPLADESGLAVLQTWMPDVATVVATLPSGEVFALDKIEEAGFFRAQVPYSENAQTYTLTLTFHDGQTVTTRDPYTFWPVISDYDTLLLSQGNHHHAYDKLGSHLRSQEDVEGVYFAVWAPNAERVSVVGHFNGWNGLRHPMRSMGASGIWELFIPGLQHGELYKYEVRAKSGAILLKSDPYGRYMEKRPNTASIVWDINQYSWNDANWMAERQQDPRKKPISIFEVHLGSWKRDPKTDDFLGYRELAQDLVAYVKEQGYTHIELMPVAEHPFDGSWGYQVIGYFAPTSRFGTPEDFMYFVDYMHQNNIGVIVDWVPGHFPKDTTGLAYFDGQALYEYADPRKGEHQDWGTHIFDYGRNEVRNFLVTNALFWLDKYHIDGLRVDAVASILYLDFSRNEGEWVPNMYGGRENLEAIDFLKRMNEVVHQYHPGVLIMAEESSAYPGVTAPVYAGGLGFDFKWGMGWMNDSLSYIESNPVYRKYDHHKISFYMVYAYSENYALPISHDEVVHGKRALLDKMPGDVWQKFAGLRVFLSYMWTMPGKKLLFMGQDFGQWQEWKHDYSLDWHLLEFPSHQGVQHLVRDLNALYTQYPALYTGDNVAGGFEWINADDADQSIYSYMRHDVDSDQYLVVLHNFTPVQRDDYRIGVPHTEGYQEIFNSDAEQYWGVGKTNAEILVPEAVPSQGYEQSIILTVPALSSVVLKRVSVSLPVIDAAE